MWYGLKIGMDIDETMSMPLGILCSLIAIEQIKNEGATLKKDKNENTDEFMRLLEYK